MTDIMIEYVFSLISETLREIEFVLHEMIKCYMLYAVSVLTATDLQ